MATKTQVAVYNFCVQIQIFQGLC